MEFGSETFEVGNCYGKFLKDLRYFEWINVKDSSFKLFHVNILHEFGSLNISSKERLHYRYS